MIRERFGYFASPMEGWHCQRRTPENLYVGNNGERSVETKGETCGGGEALVSAHTGVLERWHGAAGARGLVRFRRSWVSVSPPPPRALPKVRFTPNRL